MLRKVYVYIILSFLITDLNAQSKSFTKQLDSIQNLRRLSRDKSLDLEIRIQYAKKAIELSYKTKIDSIILSSSRGLAHTYIDKPRYFEYSKKLSYKNLKLARKLKDSIAIANIYTILGYALTTNDSAYYYYYNAIKIFESNNDLKKKDVENLVSALINLSLLQGAQQDYMGGQASLIKAINLLETLPKSNKRLSSLWNVYNLLGLSSQSLKEYNQALGYYNKSLDFGYKLTNSYESILYTKINIIELYREKGDYNKALIINNELLKDDLLIEKDPNSYGTILNNIAYTMFLNKDKNLYKIDSLFTKAHTIFTDLELFYELSVSSNDMAEFYYDINQKDKALFYSKKAYEYGKEASENSEELRALKMLSKLKEGNEGKGYLYEYIKLNDSLIDAERTSRNKYARIQFETDQYVKETKRLTTQNILILVIGSILVFVLGLLYFIKVQRTKNKALIYEQIQQEANQEIYALMLNQHEKLETGRLLERHRISEDLHDGILSQLFGTRMGFGFLQVAGDKETLKQYEQLQQELQSIEKEVRDVSHELKADSLSSKTSFETILENHIKQQSAMGNFNYSIKKEKQLSFETISNTIKVAIFRIVQEAIQNIIKHAKANTLTISFKEEENTLCLSIDDDGIGFDAKTKHKGIGLKNIASRVSKLEGTFNIISKHNQGTTINISVPI